MKSIRNLIGVLLIVAVSLGGVAMAHPGGHATMPPGIGEALVGALVLASLCLAVLVSLSKRRRRGPGGLS